MSRAYVGATAIGVVYVGDTTVAQVIGAGPGDLHYSVLPSITGTAIETLTLTANNGTVTGDPTITYTYQWFRDGVPIEGAPEFLADPELELV